MSGGNNGKKRLQRQNRNLTTQKKQLTDYIDETKDNLVNNQLYNDSVVVVRAAGDDETSADAVLALVRRASATITADITGNATFADPSSTDELKALISGLTPP